MEDGAKGNKFHVYDCEMLDKMRKKGRYDRYVVTNQLNGLFSISNGYLEGETRLNVCQYCLESVNYKKFSSLPRGAQRREYVQKFKLADFFDTYSSFFKFMPMGIADNRNIYYTSDWKNISRDVREKYDHQCQQCCLNLKEHKDLLHVHHINGVKSDNRYNNLTPLCCDCHRKQPDHEHMFIKHEDTQLIAQLRKKQGIMLKECWQDIYDIADPAMHGVIDLLECYQAPLADIGKELYNDNNDVIAKLELSWPLKKVAVTVSKYEAISATKLGWKVYSMRHALSQIDTLVNAIR